MAKTKALNPRLLAIKNFLKVQDGRSIDVVLANLPEGLQDQDRALVAELSYGLCRWYFRLQAMVAPRLRKPLKHKDRDVHTALLLGVYQLVYSRMPPHAALSTAVDAVKAMNKQWATKLVNGVLRGIQREQADIEALADRDDSAKYAQAPWFVKSIKAAWPNDWVEVLSALQQRPPMTLRVNVRQFSRDEYAQALLNVDIQSQAVASVSSALTLDKPTAVPALPSFSEGSVFVQDAAAQLAALLLDVKPDQVILDACAAPGGKTTHILEQADNLKVIALDVDEKRLLRVEENLQRMGCDAEVVVADAANPENTAWGVQQYDRILLDAPCSATGVMRRHPDIKLLRRASDIKTLVALQGTILKKLWQLLKPGGKLLYATCSILPDENDLQVSAFIRATASAREIALSEDWGHKRQAGRQILPGEQGMDGFYYALLEKTSD